MPQLVDSYYDSAGNVAPPCKDHFGFERRPLQALKRLGSAPRGCCDHHFAGTRSKSPAFATGGASALARSQLYRGTSIVQLCPLGPGDPRLADTCAETAAMMLLVMMR